MLTYKKKDAYIQVVPVERFLFENLDEFYSTAPAWALDLISNKIITVDHGAGTAVAACDPLTHSPHLEADAYPLSDDNSFPLNAGMTLSKDDVIAKLPDGLVVVMAKTVLENAYSVCA